METHKLRVTIEMHGRKATVELPHSDVDVDEFVSAIDGAVRGLGAWTNEQIKEMFGGTKIEVDETVVYVNGKEVANVLSDREALETVLTYLGYKVTIEETYQEE